MENSTDSDATRTRNDFNLFSKIFEIADINSDLARWNKDWEKVLRSIPSKDVYRVFSEPMHEHGLGDSESLSGMIKEFKGRSRELQEGAIKMWANLEENNLFSVPWMLLEGKEQRKHLLNALRDACNNAAWGQDTRAMCPEITITSLLKCQGRAFIDFMNDYSKGFKDADTSAGLYALPSKWWEGAVDSFLPWTETTEKTFVLLTIQRNDFISVSFSMIYPRVLFTFIFQLSLSSPL
jgi:hypothetical protein